MLTRRALLLSSMAALALPAVGALAQDKKTLQVYVDGDTNVTGFWNDVLKPAFEAAQPGLTFNVTATKGVAEANVTVAQRALAALSAKADPQVDFFEQIDADAVTGAAEAGLWLTLDAANVPNMAMLNPAAADKPYRLPYRGSQVLLAYDSAKIPTPPKTFADLVAWAKANPGRFTYGRPDKGGSGSNFVVRAIHEANGRDPSLFTMDNYDAAKAEEMLAKAWTILQDLHPVTYGEGAYPAGNTPALQLLAQGAVDMIPAWSDQALQAIHQGVLPETIKLVQLKDLALCGGFAYGAVPTNATDMEGTLALANFLLSVETQEKIVREMGGFPAIGWEHLPEALRAEYIDVIPVSIPTFPSGDWNKAKNDGWYRAVATNLTQE